MIVKVKESQVVKNVMLKGNKKIKDNDIESEVKIKKSENLDMEKMEEEKEEIKDE